MREIKFRAFAHATRVMFYPDSDAGWVIEMGVVKPLPNTTLMEFTGLHDKNGREIYEGDIWQYEQDGERYVVEWKESGWALSGGEMWVALNGNLNTSLAWFSDMHDHGDVIGNIWETPELQENK